MSTSIRQPKPHAATPQVTDGQRPTAPFPSEKTPQEFYAEVTKRVDVRAILKQLATG